MIYFFSFKFHLLINLSNYLSIFIYVFIFYFSIFCLYTIYVYASTVLIFDLFEIFQKKKDASRLFNLVFCFNNFTLYAIDFSEEGIEMVFS